MIYDKLDNLYLYPLPDDCRDTILSFLKDLTFTENKKIDLNDKLKALLTVYKTGTKDIIETHNKCIDVVILIEGEEKVNVGTQGTIKTIYDPLSDKTLYSSLQTACSIHLTPGNFLVFFPDDIHQPYLVYDKECLCKKVTFKIAL